MSQLETAANPQTLRRIAIDPVTRVEGHGKVTILLDENNKVHQVRLHVVEFRGFETFIEGRPFWEVPVMVQRLCGICPVSHHLASAKAMDIIVGAPVLIPTAEKLRRLLHYGQTLQSHAVHFFHLASPDLLLGFDSDHTRRNIVSVVAGFPEIATQGVLLRKYGQEVIRIVSGKRVHGAVALPGGMNKPLASDDRDLLRRDIDRMISWSHDAVQLLKKLYETEAAFYGGFGTVDSNMLALVGAKGAMDLYHGKLRAKDADGGIVFDNADYAGYRDLIQEEVKPWSYMKFPHIKSLGRDDGWYKVGPLARVQTCDFIPTALAEVERQNLLAISNGRPSHGALYYHWARLIELLHSAEVIRELLDDPDIVGKDLMAERGQRVSEAVGVIEAPRGTLLHHYRVDDDDMVTYCNMIVSTTNNNQAMNEAVRHVAKEHLCGREVTEGLLNHIEVAIRAYDPCLSCATHALGKMPLEVELLDADGSLVDRQRRNFASG